MMKNVLLVLCACAGLAGCANRSYGSWLDSYGVPPRTPPVIEASQEAAMRAEIARLQTEAESIRVKLAAEPDRVQRIAYLNQLRAIHDQVQPLQYTLRHGPQRRPSLFNLLAPKV